MYICLCSQQLFLFIEHVTNTKHSFKRRKKWNDAWVLQIYYLLTHYTAVIPKFHMTFNVRQKNLKQTNKKPTKLIQYNCAPCPRI